MKAVAQAAGAVAILLSLAHVAWLLRDVRNARDSLEAREGLRRLAMLTIRNFPGRDLDSPDLFWKSIGREGNPMKDVWGSEYRLTSRFDGALRSYFWSSAGPDRVFGTRDDISFEIPYPNDPGNLPDLEPGEPLVPPPVNTDAR